MVLHFRSPVEIPSPLVLSDHGPNLVLCRHCGVGPVSSSAGVVSHSPVCPASCSLPEDTPEEAAESPAAVQTDNALDDQVDEEEDDDLSANFKYVYIFGAKPPAAANRSPNDGQCAPCFAQLI